MGLLRILLFFACFATSESLPRWPESFHQPFWRSKSDVQKRMKDEDLIVVSAKTEKDAVDPKLTEMKVVAGGIVKAPLDFTFQQMKNYEGLKKADDHFKEVKYTPKENTLYIHVAALGYHARMHLKLNEITRDSQGHKAKEIDWLCVKGSFEGMKGVFQAVEIERQKTEISMTADYRSEKLPLPKVLMGFGMEVLGRQVATQMRNYIMEQK